MVVQTPGEALMLIVHIEGVVISAENVYCLFSANFFYFQSVWLVLLTGNKLSADFTALAITTCVNLATLGKEECMMCTACNFLHFGLCLIAEQVLCKLLWFKDLLGCLTGSNIL